MADHKTLGSRIRALRKARRWTIAELAEKVGLTENGLRFIETDRRWPRQENLEALAHALEVSIEDLFMDRQPTTPTEAPQQLGMRIGFQNRARIAADAEADILRLVSELRPSEKAIIAKAIENIVDETFAAQAIPRTADEAELILFLRNFSTPKIFSLFLNWVSADSEEFLRKIGFKPEIHRKPQPPTPNGPSESLLKAQGRRAPQRKKP